MADHSTCISDEYCNQGAPAVLTLDDTFRSRMLGDRHPAEWHTIKGELLDQFRMEAMAAMDQRELWGYQLRECSTGRPLSVRPLQP